VPFPEVGSRAVSELYWVRPATLVAAQPSILDIGLGRLTRAKRACADNNDHRSANNR
jgi:hypothetical protein